MPDPKAKPVPAHGDGDADEPRRAEGPLKYSYLCVIMDAYTKQVLAYVVSISIDVDFVLETVRQLLKKHGAELKTKTLVHSDQGCHYTSHKFIDILKDSGLRQSMPLRKKCRPLSLGVISV